MNCSLAKIYVWTGNYHQELLTLGNIQLFRSLRTGKMLIHGCMQTLGKQENRKNKPTNLVLEFTLVKTAVKGTGYIAKAFCWYQAWNLITLTFDHSTIFFSDESTW